MEADPQDDLEEVSPITLIDALGRRAHPLPWARLGSSALTRIAAGGTIYLRGGTYSSAQTITIAPSNSGTSSARKIGRAHV